MIKGILGNEVKKALLEIYPDVDVEGVKVVRSENFGDYSTNASFVLAKKLGKSPSAIAYDIVKKLSESSENGPKSIDKVEMAGGGFVNITISTSAILSMISALDESLEYGFDFLSEMSVNVEFISANPTGALHIGHGVHAFYGDVISSVFEYVGANTIREFYINDSRESAQIKELGKTALGEGEQYKTERTEKMISEINFDGMDENEAGFTLAGKIQESNKEFIEKKIGVKFDNWYSEDENIRTKGLSEKTLEDLRNADFVYDKDGAVWIKTSLYGDDEDRVVVRSDGTNSYFLADIAYHKDKFSRGYNAVIDIWGADHHGHIKRMHAVGKMLGWPVSLSGTKEQQQPIVFITQMVSLKEDGESKKMSKRAGNVILLEDLVNDFGLDVVRWFFIEKSLGTHIDFDVELAKERSQKNPVFYVQYAHARIASIVDNTKKLKPNGSLLLDTLKEEAGRKLAMKIAEFEEVLDVVSQDYGVHKLTTYAHQLAGECNQFYRDVRIVAGDDVYNSGALELVIIAKKTLYKTLSLLGISTPERM